MLGISSPAYSDEQLAQFKAEDKQKIEFEGKEYTRYEAGQLQKRIESEVRRQKDRAVIAKSSGNDVMRREAQYKINLLTNKYAKLSKESGLPTKMERMQMKGFRRVKAIKTNEAKVDELVRVLPPMKGDAIKPQSIYKELHKSKVGKEVWSYIVDNQPDIEVNYSTEIPPDIRGVQKGKKIRIYAHNTKTIKVTTETLIHEITHMKLDIGGDQWAEAVCFVQEKRHSKDVLTFSDKRDIIKKVKRLYPHFIWRKR